MPRRFAIAVALAMTVVVTYTLVALGAGGGVFDGGSGKSAALTLEPGVASTAQGAMSTDAAVARSPVVITEYVYVDGPAQGAAGTEATSRNETRKLTYDGDDHDDDDDDDDDGDRHGGGDDERHGDHDDD